MKKKLLERIVRIEEKQIASSEALSLAREQLASYKEQANNVRQEIVEDRQLSCPAPRADALEQRIANMEKALNTASGKESGSDIAWGKVTVILGIMFSAVALILNWQK